MRSSNFLLPRSEQTESASMLPRENTKGDGRLSTAEADLLTVLVFAGFTYLLFQLLRHLFPIHEDNGGQR